MTASAFTVPNLAKLNMVNATNLLGANTANYRLALVSSAWTPNNTTDELWATASGSEIAGTGGYTTGGKALTGVALTQTGGTVKFTADPVVWTATPGGIAAWRRAVLYYAGTLNGKLNPIIAHALGDDTPADVPATTDGNTLTITPNAAGLVTLS